MQPLHLLYSIAQGIFYHLACHVFKSASVPEADTGIASEAPLYAEMRVTSAAHCTTGQRMGSFVFHCVMVFNFLPFFCISKVMASLFADLRFGEGFGILLLSL